MDEKLNVTIGYEVKTVDGKKFFDATLNYYDMGRDKLVVVEEALIGCLTQLNEAGKAALAK